MVLVGCFVFFFIVGGLNDEILITLKERLLASCRVGGGWGKIPGGASMSSCEIPRQVGWEHGTVLLLGNTTQRHQNCPQLFTNARDGQRNTFHLKPERSCARACVADTSCAVELGLSATFHILINFNCYLDSKGNLPVNGKFCPSVNFGSNAW